MDLEGRKKYLENNLKGLYKRLEDLKKEIEFLKDKRQPKTSELYNGIENFFTVTITNSTYEFILGGDGRSAPWSEKRSGLVATIKVNDGIYLNSDQKEIVKQYVKEVHNPDHIVFKKYYEKI